MDIETQSIYTANADMSNNIIIGLQAGEDIPATFVDHLNFISYFAPWIIGSICMIYILDKIEMRF